MPKVRITKPFAKGAEHVGDGNQTLWYDDGPGHVRGLALRCTAGSRTWILEYRSDRNRGGPRRRLAIAAFEDLREPSDARDLARDLLAALVKDGTDPRESLLPNRGDTLAAVAGRYLEDLRQRAEDGRGAKRSGYQTMRARLERHVVGAAIGRTRIGELTREAVKRWHAAIGKGAPVEANRALTALSAVYGFAQAEGSVADLQNPTRHVPRFEERGERRALTRGELERLGAALAAAERDGHVTVERKGDGGKVRKVRRSVHPSAVLAIRLLALAGLRRGEVVGSPMKARRNGADGLEWGDVEFAVGTLRLRDTKTGAQRRVLGKATLALLATAKPEDAEDADPVCPGRKRDKRGRRLPMASLDKARAALWEAAGIPAERGVDLHSLRHSFASIGATLDNGAYVGAVAPLLGHRHVKAGVTERYITGEADGLRGAADAIAAELAGLLGLDLPDVVAIRGER